MKKLLLLALFVPLLLVGNPSPKVILTWSFESCYRDVLESFNVQTSQWQDVAGPYSRTADKKFYRVVVETKPTTGELFRVRREFGLPWLPDEELAALLGGLQPQPQK